MKGGPRHLQLRIHAIEVMGCSKDDIAGDECSRRASNWSGDDTGDDADGSVGVLQRVILYWEVRFFPLRVVGVGWVTYRLKRCLGVQVAIGKWWCRATFKLIGKVGPASVFEFRLEDRALLQAIPFLDLGLQWSHLWLIDYIWKHFWLLCSLLKPFVFNLKLVSSISFGNLDLDVEKMPFGFFVLWIVF